MEMYSVHIKNTNSLSEKVRKIKKGEIARFKKIVKKNRQY